MIACAAVTVALVGAQSADAAFSYASSAGAGTAERSALHCGGGSASQSARGRSAFAGPCYPVAVEVWGDGRVTSITPAAVPGATGAAEYPNGHIDCPESGIWDCNNNNYFFNWSFGDDTTVVLQAMLTGSQVFTGWVGCPHVEADPLQCRIELEDPVACIEAHFEPAIEPVPSPCDEVPQQPLPLNVKVIKAGPGGGKVTSNPVGINCGTGGTVCQRNFSPGAVTLIPAPSPGSGFGGWTLSCVVNSTGLPCSPPSCSGTGSCTWTVALDRDYSATATFTGTPPPPPLLNSVLLSKPKKTTKTKTATFYWGAKNAAGTFVSSYKSQCKFDNARTWTTCKPGKTYKKLKPGTHTFRVRVGNANGYDKSPASYSWKVKK